MSKLNHILQRIETSSIQIKNSINSIEEKIANAEIQQSINSNNQEKQSELKQELNSIIIELEQLIEKKETE